MTNINVITLCHILVIVGKQLTNGLKLTGHDDK